MDIDLGKQINSYLDYLKYERKMSENTYLSYRYNFIKIVDYFQSNDLLSLTPDDIKMFLYNQKNSAKTRAHYLTVLKSFYNYMLDLELLKVNPCEEIKSPKQPQNLPKYLSEEEVLKLLDIELKHPLDYRNKAMLELLYATGMRVSEMLDLTMSSVNLKDESIKVMGKGKKERIIPLADITIKYLKMYIDEYRAYILKTKESNYLFVNYNGKRMSRQGFYKILKQICQKCHIDKEISPHILRHSFATHLINNGADLRVIQELLGHENISTTEIYSHISKQKILEDYQKHPHY